MNKEEAIRMLKAKLECMTRDGSCTDDDCINRRCDECSLNYEQGNMGEQKEWLRMAIKALEQQMSKRTEERTETHECDCISRKAVLESLHRKFADGFDSDRWWNSTVVLYAISETPSVTPQSKTGQGTHVKKGHWIEHKHGGIEHIECSECGIWFLKADLPRKSYCPNCGSCNGDMIKNIMRDIAKTMSGGTK